MAKMCPIDGCQAKKGLCIHDKMMLGMAALAVVGGVAVWVFQRVPA